MARETCPECGLYVTGFGDYIRLIPAQDHSAGGHHQVHYTREGKPIFSDAPKSVALRWVHPLTVEEMESAQTL